MHTVIKQTDESVDPASGLRAERTLRTGEMLLARGIISRAQLESALAHQATRSPRPRLGAVLAELGFATSEQIVQAIASHASCPYVHLEPGMVHPNALRALPSDYLEQHNLLPLRVAEGWITVALEQFNDPFVLADIERRTGLRVQPVAAVAERVRAARQAVASRSPAGATTGTSETVGALEVVLGDTSADELQVIEDRLEDDSDLEASAAESPIVRLVNLIIKRALELGASDIHIEPDEANFQIRYRVDGELVTGERPHRRLLPAVVSRVKILAGMDISQRRLPQDGCIAVRMKDHALDLRVSTMATRQGEKVVLRIVDRNAGVRPLQDLGIEGDILKIFRQAIRQPHGLILVTGPTGSGKSTTLYSALSEISSELFNTSTIEDPVERRLKGVNQFQVHEESGFTFGRALRSLLRQDPDILMVGEIRDPETARLATEAALTGHLVLSTLHTNDAPSAVPRLLSMGAERFLVAATLRSVMAQRLVKRLCQSCRKATQPTSGQSRALQGLCGDLSQLKTIYVARGCQRCNNRGSIGRIGVFDLLALSEEQLSAAFADGATLRLEIIRGPRDVAGLLADGLAKARKGLIGLDSLFELVCQADVADHALPKELTSGGAQEANNAAI